MSTDALREGREVRHGRDEREVREVRLATGDYTVILPGTWASIPLDDADAMTKRISALVKRQVGTDDRLARRRNQARRELLENVQDAARENAVSYSLALELLPGLPFPVALIARYEPFAVHAPAPDSQAGDSTHLRDDLAAAYPTADIVALPGPGLVARVVVTGVTTYVEESTPSLACDYWVPVPDGVRALRLSFSMAMCPDAVIVTQLFDAIVDSLRWDILTAASLDLDE